MAKRYINLLTNFKINDMKSRAILIATFYDSVQAKHLYDSYAHNELTNDDIVAKGMELGNGSGIESKELCAISLAYDKYCLDTACITNYDNIDVAEIIARSVIMRKDGLVISTLSLDRNYKSSEKDKIDNIINENPDEIYKTIEWLNLSDVCDTYITMAEVLDYQENDK